MTFSSWTDSPQISAGPNSYQYLILLVPFCKMMSLKQNKLRLLVQRCFLPRSRATAKAMRYAGKTLSFQDTTLQATK